MPEGTSGAPVAETVYTKRAQYNDPQNAFAFRWPDVPRRQFLAERDRAFDPATGTADIPLDSSRYLRIAAGENIATAYRASGAVYYVMAGAGESTHDEDNIVWGAGDVFCFPGGGGETAHVAGSVDAVLFVTTNEPLLAFERLEPPKNPVIQTVHYPAAEIARRFEAVYAREQTDAEAGRAILFSSAAVGECTNMLPSINVAINTLQAGGDQRPHRHNGVAITLAIQGEGIHSMIEDEKIPWSTGAAQITPATELHSHHNRGTERMVSLVVQDEALHYYTRTPGFSWD